MLSLDHIHHGPYPRTTHPNQFIVWMRQIKLLVLLLASALCQNAAQPGDCDPWGVRLNLGDYYMFGQGYQLGITFNTKQRCQGFLLFINGILVNFSTSLLSYDQKDYLQPFDTYIHRVEVSNLPLSNSTISVFKYEIRLPSENIVYSNQARVVSREATHDFKALVIGDWGLLDDEHKKIYYDVFPCIQGSLNDYLTIGFILFLGDLGYELSDRQGQVYFNTLSRISQFTARIPFMIAPGNHDTKYSYELFQKSFFSPNYNTTNNYFYTFQVGKHTFMSLNPEKHVYTEYPVRFEIDVLRTVKEYILENYESINNLVPFCHYPIFCSDPNEVQCSTNHVNLQGLINAFESINVNVYLGAHIHVYERSYPISKSTFNVSKFVNLSPNSSFGRYQNTTAITYISEGAGANNYFIYTTEYLLKDYTANRVINGGYGIMSLSHNDTRRIVYDHITAKDCSVADHLEVVRAISPKIPIEDGRVYLVVFLVIGGVLLLAGALFMVYRHIRRRKLTVPLVNHSAGNTGSASENENREMEVKVEHFTEEL